MAAKSAKRLEELEKKASAAGHWPLAVASRTALMEEGNLDHQINVIGAMHEVGHLRNRLEPFWREWRTDSAAWSGRCVERLQENRGDHDYWAVAAMLGMDIRLVWPVLKKAGYGIKYVRAWSDLNRLNTHFAVFAPKMGYGMDRVWAPVIELGWDQKSGEIQDAARHRAILFDTLEKEGANHVGKGTGSYFVRAALPHGSWRVVSSEIEYLRETAIPVEKTLLKKA